MRANIQSCDYGSYEVDSMPEVRVANTSRVIKKKYNILCTPCVRYLTLKAPITTEVDDIHQYIFYCFSEKIRLDVSSEFSARQRIGMKNQALFSSKDKSKKSKCRLLQFLFGA